MMRRRPVILAGLVWVLSIGTAGCTGDNPTAQSSPSEENTRGIPGSVAPDGGQVRVVESGYTAIESGFGMATFGAILENTSKDRAAVEVTATARFLDAAGEEVRLLGTTQPTSAAVTIPPGGRMGVGDQFLGDLRGRSAVRMELSVVMTGWWPASRVTGVVASEVRHARDDQGSDFFSFAVDSHLAKPLVGPRIVIIVRDHSNKVIGGLIPDRPLEDWPPGRSAQRVKLPWLAVPETADLVRTEVFVGDAEIDKRQA